MTKIGRLIGLVNEGLRIISMTYMTKVILFFLLR
jgi:hypothetical protein